MFEVFASYISIVLEHIPAINSTRVTIRSTGSTSIVALAGGLQQRASRDRDVYNSHGKLHILALTTTKSKDSCCFFFMNAATQAVINKMQNCLFFVICIIVVYPRATRLGLQSCPMVLLRSTDQLISNMQFNHWPR